MITKGGENVSNFHMANESIGISLVGCGWLV